MLVQLENEQAEVPTLPPVERPLNMSNRQSDLATSLDLKKRARVSVLHIIRYMENLERAMQQYKSMYIR